MDKNIIRVIIGTVIITALVVGGTVFYAQNFKIKRLQDDINNLKDEIEKIKNTEDNNNNNNIGGLQDYRSKELGIKFSYPSLWNDPVVGSINYNECKFNKISLSEGKIYIIPKDESLSSRCFKIRSYFECGINYFECSPSLTSFNCEPYKDSKNKYDGMRIWDDLKKDGYDCSLSWGKPYAPFVYDSDLLKRQFDILEKISNEGKLDKETKNDIIKNLDIFYPNTVAGTDDKFYVDLINNDHLGVYGIKIIGYAGSDVSADNYYYRSVFLKDDKIVTARFRLFTEEMMPWADAEMLKSINSEDDFDDRIIESLKTKDKNNKIYKTVQQFDLVSKSISLY